MPTIMTTPSEYQIPRKERRLAQGVAGVIVAMPFLVIILRELGLLAEAMGVLRVLFYAPVIFATILIFAFAYFLPTLNAYDRHHRNRRAVFILNILLGWTFLGWVVAMIWSFTADVEPGYDPNSWGLFRSAR